MTDPHPTPTEPVVKTCSWCRQSYTKTVMGLPPAAYLAALLLVVATCGVGIIVLPLLAAAATVPKCPHCRRAP